MSQGFFLNPTIIQEILLWKSNASENLIVFEPVAQACSAVGALLSPDDDKKASEISKVLENWCSSMDFDEMLTEAGKKNVSIDISLGRESLARYAGSESFVAGVPIDVVLSAFSALIRADLRARESRSSARIDELFLWQAAMETFSLHDITLLILAACASKDVITTFDHLLAIKDQPATLSQIRSESLSANLTAQFISGMRMYALSNFDAADRAFALAIEKDPESPSAYIAMSLIHLLNEKADLARRLIEEGARRTDSTVVVILRNLISILHEKQRIEPWDHDPISTFVLCFLLLADRQYQQTAKIAKQHLTNYPDDLLVSLLLSEAELVPIRERYYDDPPVPGTSNSLPADLNNIEKLLSRVNEQCSSLKLSSLHARSLTNCSLLSLMTRDFSSAAELAEEVLAINSTRASAKINLSTAMLVQGKLPLALRALEFMPQESALRARRLAAEAYYHACAFDLALDIWKRDLPLESDRLWKLRTLCRMLEVYRLLRDSENAQECVDNLLTHFQHEPETLFALGYELWQMGRADDAITALRRAKEHALPNLKKWISWELGRILFDAGQTLSATDEYVAIAEKSVDSIQTRELAVALYKAGLLPAAYERAKALRETHKDVVPGITEIETDFLVRENKLTEAKQLLLRLSEVRPLSVLNRLAIVRISVALGQEEEARQKLAEIGQLNLTREMKEEVERFTADLDVVLALKNKGP